MTGRAAPPRIGILWRGDRSDPSALPRDDRGLRPLYDALGSLPAEMQFVPYADEAAEEVRQQLLTLDGVLVWVNPIQDGATRQTLDQVLREVSDQGVWVSAHPDVTTRIGTKEVLYTTRTLGWGSDTELYSSSDDFAARFPVRLAERGRLVLKQARGNGGNGVWRVETPGAQPQDVDQDTVVRVQDASTKDSSSEMVTLGSFVTQCAPYFDWSGSLVDQAYQDRLREGLIRCYFSGSTVVGFCHQWPKALLDDEATPRPTPTMEGPETPEYQVLKHHAQSEWVPQMLQTVGLDTRDLPAIWDADFLFGPRAPRGDDSFVLCEINVSAVWPFPPTAAKAIADVTLERALQSQSQRQQGGTVSKPATWTPPRSTRPRRAQETS